VRYTPAATLQFPYLKLHQCVYRHSGGLIGSRVVAGRALLLTTTGRGSGEPRTCALIYLKDGERLVVVASNGGSDHPPSWLLNLQADPDVGVQIGRKKFSARASVASAEERERLWPRVNRHNMGLAPIMHPGARGRYDVYQRHTTRLILSSCWNEARKKPEALRVPTQRTPLHNLSHTENRSVRIVTVPASRSAKWDE
jgi:deazaflavin-dependent oxidoreductase (nitroreductase family)